MSVVYQGASSHGIVTALLRLYKTMAAQAFLPALAGSVGIISRISLLSLIVIALRVVPV